MFCIRSRCWLVMFLLLAAGAMTLSVFGSVAYAEVPQFRAETIDPAIADRACYAVTLADVDGDDRDDIVAVTEDQVLWYQNPSWEKHVMLDGGTEQDNVCIAAHDIDGDGQIDFALGAGWTKVGTLQWITRGDSLDDPWQVHSIGVEPWTHRMRIADVLGTGQPQLTVSPLNASEGRPGVRLTAFEIPSDPRREAWRRTVLNGELNRMHNHWHAACGPQRAVPTLAASQEGVHLIRWNTDAEKFETERLHAGMRGSKPAEQGAGEIKVSDGNQGRFIATIEPMHGHSVVVYPFPCNRKPGTPLERYVLDDTLKQGHAIWPVDLDGDGDEELVVGHREAGTGPVKGPGIYIYECEGDLASWRKVVLDDGGIAVEDLICADLNGDGKPEIVAGGRATKNLKLYVNLGK